MPSLVVIGAQWGDEGKGKIVDYLAPKAEWVVRFQGGNNAGHTIVAGGVTTKLNLIPSGVLRPDTRCLIAAGVVIDPEVFAAETAKLREAGLDLSPRRLVVDRDAHLVLEYHRLIDAAREEARGANRIGTTGRGIGPAYEDRANRSGVRVAELEALGQLRPRLEELVAERNVYLQAVLRSEFSVDFENVWRAVCKAAELLLPHIGNGSLILDRALRRGERVLFEGAQGSLLDQVHGTFPYVTSSHTISGGVATGCGIGPKHMGHVLGIAKAYSTRVGLGPFPTELHDQLGHRIREAGVEYGTVTGRPRRCGWFDAVGMRRAIRLNGIDSLALTKLDVLSGLSSIKVCTSYRLDGNVLEDVPSLSQDLERVEAEYLELPGWSSDLKDVRSWGQLPVELKAYLEKLSEILECPISIISVGADRQATFVAESASEILAFIR
ncbi:MAG: adenylosuccinate synthase [Deltaproteobacteria bacterium]|nr:adenylosuccinate synthase [Deltaproteobacteria bacterium]